MFRSLFNRKEKRPIPEVMNLTIGRTFSIDPIELKLLSSDTLFIPPETDLRIVAQGFCDLGEQSYLHRFYPNDDRYLLQVQGGDASDDARVDEIVLWYVFDVHYITHDANWDAIASAVRKPEYILQTDNQPTTFERVWFSHSDADEQPMTYWEDIRETRDTDDNTRIFQTAMLFGRALEDGSDEMLLVNLEEPDQGDRAASFLVGRALMPHALIT